MGFSFGNALSAVEDEPTRACLMRLGREIHASGSTISTLVRNSVSTSTITAGAGLTGGGPLNSITSVTLDVGAGTGITVNADSISISSSYLGANPTATIGLAAVNGTATTYMRSDAAPPLSVGIVPTWTGIHTFSAQDVHNAGVSLGTSGVLRSVVADAGIVYDLADGAGAGVRTSGTEFAIRRTADSRTMMEVTWDGRFGFGYTSGTLGTIAQAAHVLSFLAADSDAVSGSPTYVGILASMKHDNAAETVPRLVGVVGNATVATASRLSAVVINGVTGSVSTNVASELPGKVLACFSGSLSTSNDTLTMEPTTKDIDFGMNAHPSGGYDHLTVLWAPTFTLSSQNGYPSDANRPGVVSSARLCIQDWGGGEDGNHPYGELWAIRGEDTKGETETFPAHTGYIRMTYPRRTGGTQPAVHATHAYWEPWPNTKASRAGALDGDTYFDNGANFQKGLWEYAGAWHKLMQYTQTDAIAGTGGALCYASVHGEEIAWSQSAAQNTWYEVSDTDMADGQLGNGATHDGSGKITVPNAGMYQIAYSITFEVGAANKHVESAISISGTEQTPGQSHLETLAAGIEHIFSSVAILSLSAGATIEVSMRQNDTGSATITVDDVNISVVQLTGSPAILAAVTGGATGPTTATQSKWAKVMCLDGTAGWVPVWV